MALETELKKLNFSDKEARVYLALLELGEAPVQKIAEKAKVNRATTYVILESLKKRAAAGTMEKGKKTYFVAENPTTLFRFFKAEQDELDSRERDFKKILPELEALSNFAGEKPRVRYYEGKEGMTAFRRDLLQSGAKELLEIYSLDEVRHLFDKRENEEFLREREKKNISLRAIYTSEQGPWVNFLSAGDRKFLTKDKFPFSADISVYGTRLAITTLRNKHITIIVDNKEIADTMRLVFELAWRGAGENTG